jgi:alpha-glucosidase
VPMQPVMQYVGETPITELTLHVYHKNGTTESVLYDDGGEGYAYRDGQKTVRRFTVTGSAEGLVLAQAIEGDYAPSYATYRVVLHGVAGTIAVTADGQAAEVTEVTLETGLNLPSLVVPVGFGEVRVNVVAAAAGKVPTL